MMPEWVTVREAAELLGISRRQVINRIHEGKLKAKRDKAKWLVHSSLSEPDEEVPLEVPTTPGKFQEEIGYLRQRIEDLQEQLRQKDRTLEEARKAAEEASQRHDTIVLQLTRQLEQSQRLLEYHQEPWYRRWFRKRTRE